ncbi:MAG: fructosamine kinase family protein [Gemmatimonadota bacterium]
MLAGALRAAIDEALRGSGAGPVRAALALGGGSFGATYRIDAATDRFFLKLGAAAHPFAAEAQALAEIAATRTLRTPRPVAHGSADGQAFLLLEWIDLAADGDWSAAGERCAALHAIASSAYGWPRDNSIGATPQFNARCASWAEFWRERRLRPQFRFAQARGLATLAALEERACRASDRLLLAHTPAASLLHGDLWRGNLAFDARGEPVVFDPATYHGDAETDIAMTRLFGGFPRAFHAAYQAARAPSEGALQRLSLYQLYHVLNHANLFGGGYAAQAAAIIAALGAR